MNWEKEKDHREDAKTPRNDLNEGEERVASAIVDAALKVHKALGPGLLESVYEACLAYELEQRGHRVRRQMVLPVHYDGLTLDAGLRLDMVVDDLAGLELTSVEHLLPVHHAQLLTYLKLSGLRLGFLLNFNVSLMKEGIVRKILQGSDHGYQL